MRDEILLVSKKKSKKERKKSGDREKKEAKGKERKHEKVPHYCNNEKFDVI